MWKPGILLPPSFNSLIGMRDCRCCNPPGSTSSSSSSPQLIECSFCPGGVAPKQWMATVGGFSKKQPNGCTNCDIFNRTVILDFDHVGFTVNGIFGCMWKIVFSPALSADPCPDCMSIPGAGLSTTEMILIIGQDFNTTNFAYNFFPTTDNSAIHAKLTQTPQEFDCKYSGALIDNSTSHISNCLSGPQDPHDGCDINLTVSIEPII